MSKFGLIIALSYLLFSAIYITLIPYFDIPDFEIRNERILSGQVSNLDITKYIYPDDFKVDYEYCQYSAGTGSLTSDISLDCIDKNLEIWFSRWIFNLIIFLPLLILGLFNNKISNIGLFSRNYLKNSQKINAISLSVLTPSVIYLLSGMTNEGFLLMIAMMLILAIENIVLLIALGFLLMFLDHGLFMVYVIFIVFYYLVNFSKIFPTRFKIGITITFLASIYLFNLEIMNFLSSLGIQSKFREVYLANLDTLTYENSWNISRPVYTFLTMIFSTAYGMKSIFLYIAFLVFILITLFGSSRIRHSIKESESSESMIGFSAALITIVVFVFLSPNHAYGKYYLFLIPFFIYHLLNYLNRKQVFIFLFLSNILLLLNVGFFYV